MNSIKISALLFFAILNFQNAFAGKLEANLRAFFAAVDAGDLEKAETYLSPDLKVILPIAPQTLDFEGYSNIRKSFKTGFSDLQHKILECTEGKNSLGFKAMFLGTNTGMLMGNPPSGNRVELPFLGYFKFDDAGKIVEINSQFDLASFRAQLMKGRSAADYKMIATESMKELDSRNLQGVIRNCTKETKFYGFAPMPVDADGYVQAMSDLLAAFPDSKFTIDDIVAENNKVVVRHHLTGTHTGKDFQGIKISNKKVMVTATVTFEYSGDKVSNVYLNADHLSMMQQLSTPMSNN